MKQFIKRKRDYQKLAEIMPFWLLLVLVIVFLLRIPFFFSPYYYGDECIYLTLGEAIRRGFSLYKDIHDNKPPLLYLIAALAGSLFWFRAILAFWHLATVYLFFRLSQTFFSQRQKLIKVSTALFALLTTVPSFEGQIANAENFMILPTLAGILLLFCGKLSLKRAFAAGILFSSASLFKVPAAFDFAAFFVFLAFFTQKDFFQTHQEKLKKLFFLAFGFATPIIATILYFGAKGVLSQYFVAAFGQNIDYLSSWQLGWQRESLIPSGLLLRGMILAFFTLAFWLLRKKLAKTTLFIFLWFGFALFAALLSERPYPHYLLQVLPPLSLFVFLLKEKAGEKVLAVSFVALFLWTISFFRFWYYPNLPYYQNFLELVLGKKTQGEYLKTFKKGIDQTYKLADFLNENTRRQEKIFAWGDSACLYALSRRLPVGRYTTSYHIVDFRAQEETLEAIENQEVRLIIDLQNEARPFPGFYSLLEKKYLFFKEEGKARIFVLAPSY